jgi:hypothetical protein
MYKSSSETLQMLEEVYGKATVNRTQICQWHNVEHVHNVVQSDAEEVPSEFFTKI